MLPSKNLSGRPRSLKLEDLERWAIRRALRRSQGTIIRAARLLGLNRDTLASKMKRYGINKDGN